MFLGVDPAVKVDVKPVKKHRTTRGILSKSAATRYEHRVKVKNTKQRAVRVTVAMSLPRSTDEDIAVNLLAPSEKELENNSGGGNGKPPKGGGDVGAAVTAEGGIEAAALSGDAQKGDWTKRRVLKNEQTNNLVWLVEVPAGGSEDITFAYEIETPAGKEAEIV